MSTNGIYGFRKNKNNKITYNHYDSYPSSLGCQMIKYIKKTSIKKMNEIFDSVIIINNCKEIPSQEQINHCMQFQNSSLSNDHKHDWYFLLEFTRGDLFAYNKGLKYMVDATHFSKDKLFCQWGYIIDLDSETLEIYKNTELVLELSLSEIKKNGTYVNQAEMNEIESNWKSESIDTYKKNNR